LSDFLAENHALFYLTLLLLLFVCWSSIRFVYVHITADSGWTHHDFAWRWRPDKYLLVGKKTGCLLLVLDSQSDANSFHHFGQTQNHHRRWASGV